MFIFPKTSVYAYCVKQRWSQKKHVIVSCPVYEDLRRELFIKAFSINSDFYEMSSDAKLCFIMSNTDIVKFTAKTLNSILILRRKIIFK